MSEFENFKQRIYTEICNEQSAEQELYNKLNALLSGLHKELVQLRRPTERFTVVASAKTRSQTNIQKLLFAPEIIPAHTVFDENGWTIFGGEIWTSYVDRVDYYSHNSEVFILECGKVALYDRGEGWVSKPGQIERNLKIPADSVYRANDESISGVIVDSVTAYKFLLEKAQQIQRKTRYNNYNSVLELIKPNILKLING